MLGALIGLGVQGHAANQSAEATAEATAFDLAQKRKALGLQQEQYDRMQALMNPFYESGQQALQGLQQNAQGFGSRLNEIMQMPEMQAMIAEENKNQTNQLRSAGLGRSGAGQLQLANIPVNQAMNYENTLNNRMQSLANQSQTSGMNLNNLNQANVNQQSGLLNQMGNSASRGAIMEGNFNQAGMNAIINGGANVLDYYR